MMQEGNQNIEMLSEYMFMYLSVHPHVTFTFYQRDQAKRKLKAILFLEKEMQQVELSRAVDTVFIGGGTPGLLKPDELARLCSLINELGLKESPEWTSNWHRMR